MSGLVGFVDTLKAVWRGFLLRTAGAFLVLALLWMVLAPPHAHLLTAFASPLIPSIESSLGTRYIVEGTHIIAERPLMRQTITNLTVVRAPLRDTSGDYPLALLAALVLATPTWSLKRRGQVLAATVGLLILTQFLSFLINIEYTKPWPQQTAAGLVVSTDYSKAKMILFDWLYAFTEFMGRGFFALAVLLRRDRADLGSPGAPDREERCRSQRAVPTAAGSRPSGAAGDEGAPTPRNRVRFTNKRGLVCRQPALFAIVMTAFALIFRAIPRIVPNRSKAG